MADEFDEAAQFILGEQQNAQREMVTSLEDDPEEAARAVQLGAATGVDPSIVYGDVKGFEREHKTALTSELIRSNQFLSDYVNSSPMAAKVSNDDFAQLDASSTTLRSIATKSVLKAAIDGFHHGAGEGGIGSWMMRDAKGAEFVRNYRMSAAVMSVLGAVVEIPLRVGGGLVQAVSEGVGEVAAQTSGNPQHKTYGRQFGEFIQDPAVLASIGLPLHGKGPGVRESIGHNKMLRDAIDRVGPYIESGKEPPVGVHPVTDQAKVEQAKSDGEKLKEALKEVSASATKERSPEMMADFVRQHTKDTEIYISADAVRELYGDKLPDVGDGLLGFVPNLREQLARAEATGGDIQVSLADYLGKIDPKVAKDIADFVRMREEGLTIAEAKEVKPAELEPPKQDFTLEFDGMTDIDNLSAYQFYIQEGGVNKARVHIIEQDNGKTLYVEDIRGMFGEGARDFGPTAMRSIMDQVGEAFPNAEFIAGHRKSGARQTVENGPHNEVKMRIKRRIEVEETVRQAAALEPITTQLEATAKPVEAVVDMATLEGQLFAKANAIGMTVPQYNRYMKLIERRQKEDIDASVKANVEAERKRQTKEWKENTALVRAEVAEAYNLRPDVAADVLLRDGTYAGQKVDVKLGEQFLTDEQKAGLPKEYYSKDGVHPTELAEILGQESGLELIRDLSRLVEERKTANMRPQEFSRLQIARETEFEMERRFGQLDENIIDAAKDRVLTDTQLDLLHEEVTALGMRAGAEFPITKQALIDWISTKFEESGLKEVRSDKMLADAGKAGRTAEMALLKGDTALAFREKQRQYIAVVMAKEGRKLEKEMVKFQKTAKRMASREVKGIKQEFTNFIHAILLDTGMPVKRSIQDVRESIARDGYVTMDEFAAKYIDEGWDLQVADFIHAEGGKPIQDMTVAEFRQVKDTIDSMIHVGREVNKVEVAGQKMELAELKEQILANIQTLPPRDKNKLGKVRLRFDAELVRMEEIAKDLDLRQELGPLFNALIRPMAEAKNKEYTMLEKLSKDMEKIKGFDAKWQKTMEDPIPQKFFVDPWDGVLFDLKRSDMIQIMLNFGNKSNIEKFVKGYGGKDPGGFETNLRSMIDQHATKQDWEFVQKIWDLFEEWKKDSDDLYHSMSGLTPKWLQDEPVRTPHGTFRGGYYPIIYDKMRSNLDVLKEQKSNSTFSPNYFRATTGNGYTKQRTGYVDYIDFQKSIDQVGGRMQQIIHDIAYRRAVVDARKIIYDKEIRGAIRKHYGPEYEGQLDPWLKDIANHFNQAEQQISFANAVMRRARMNLMIHALGINLKVLLSPDVASFNPKTVAGVLWNRSENVKLAHEKSQEIPHTFRNMDRDFREKLERTIASKGWAGVQADIARWAFLPMVKVSQGFRIVTWVDNYKDGLARGLSETDAVAIADSKVRERHGSSGLPDLPAMMRSNEAMKVATMFYGFFNTMYNWQRQLPGNVRRQEWKSGLDNVYGSILVPAAFGALLFNKSDEKDSWFKTIGKALLLQPMSTLPFVREFAGAFIEGNTARSPIGSLIQAGGSVVSDVNKINKGETPKKLIQHTANLTGLTVGLPLAQIGRTTQFGYDVATGAQRPKNILEWTRGIVHGEAKQRK